jgi:hypothetical protein
MNLRFQVFENSQRTSGLYEGQAKNSRFRVGSLTQCFDFVEPQVEVETGSTTSENHWSRVKTSYLTFGNCWSRAYICPTITHMRRYLSPSSSVWHLFHWALSPIKLWALCGTCFIELCTPIEVCLALVSSSSVYPHRAVWCCFACLLAPGFFVLALFLHKTTQHGFYYINKRT